MKRTIDFLNIASFMVEVERVKDPSLKTRPAVVAPLNSDSAKVWDASFEAKECGIRKGMELAIARRLERNLRIVEPNPDLYNSIHKKLLHQASRLTPLFESAGGGKIYLDFTGFDKLYGRPEDFALKVKKSISENFSLSPRMGVAPNKLVAKAATNPYLVHQDIFWVPRPGNFLDPFPNHALPVIKELKQSPHLADVFDDLNLLTVQDLKSLDLLSLEAIFPGKHELIFQMARGIDHRPVIPLKREPSIVVEAHLDETNSLNKLWHTLLGLADQAFAQMRAKSYLTGKMRIALRYCDYKYLERVAPLRGRKEYAHEVTAELERSLGYLFTRRTSVRYLMLELMDLRKKETQLSLFDDPNKPLLDALDKINKKFPRKLKFGRELI